MATNTSNIARSDAALDSSIARSDATSGSNIARSDMASGIPLAEELSNNITGSDTTPDLPCSSCLKDKKQVDSAKFCLECKQYLCQACLSYHSRFSSTASHNAIDNCQVIALAESVAEVDIWFSSDSSAPRDVQGMCLVTRGNIRYLLLTDWQNKTVKSFNMETMRITSAVTLTKMPYGICEVPSSGLIVVTVRDADELAVMILNETGALSLYNAPRHANLNLKVPTFSRGIVVMNGASGDHLLVLNCGNLGREGRKASLSMFSSSVKTLDGQEVKYPVYTYSVSLCVTTQCFPKNIALSRDGEQLLITDEGMGVIVTDVNGKMIRIITDPVLRGARGICTDDDGNIYVSGMKSANVVKFSPDGNFVGEVVNRLNGLVCPISLCYDQYTRSLVVGSREKVPLRVVKLRP